MPVKAVQQMQKSFCVECGATFVESPPEVNSGFSTTTEGLFPINGLRHPATDGTTGWYLWCGEEYSTAADFFSPIHTAHVQDRLPEIVHLLGLPPGYRFLVAPNHQDVWFDPSLLLAE